MSDINMTMRKLYIGLFEKIILGPYKNNTSPFLLNTFRRDFFVDRSYRESISKYGALIMDIFLGLTTLVFAQDIYLDLNHKIKLGSADEDDFSLMTNVSECLSSGEYESLFDDINNIDKIIQKMIDMVDASALRKVELFKSLDDKDIELLSSTNPYFMQEYEHYNIEISKDFLIRHLHIWEKKTDYETAISLVTKFIMNIYKLRCTEGKKIVDIVCEDEEKKNELLYQLEMNDFDLVAPFVRIFYDGNKLKSIELK